eukprot:gb/GECH01006795.1/.p1 GENE.gb/GECH01006795.1/~~gb/GECH01006795.1/.p1  ORF type:complete len:424 (+),score=111.40 gb/GECH01006795.1/:1-1272(+)
MKKLLCCFNGSKENDNTEPKSQKHKEQTLPEVDDPEAVLVEKLRKGNRQAANLPDDELREWARSLYDKETLKDCYLNADFARTASLFDNLSETQQKANADAHGGGSSFLSSVPASTESAPQSQAAEGLEDTDFDIQQIREEHASDMRYQSLAQVKVKLVIGEICKSDMQKTIRKMLSPVLTTFDHQQQFGMFHSAVVIGPWYIEWNNSSLCIPRKCYSSAAIIAADMIMPGKQNTVNLNDAIETLSEVITKWNVHYTYDQSKNNCQTFVDEIASALGFDLSQFQGPLATFLTNLREKGQCDIQFPVNPEMREYFGIKESAVKFDSHKELDEFVLKLMEKEKMLETKYPDHWMLLKSFDRAFWLRHFRNPNNDGFKPLEKCIEGEENSDTDSDELSDIDDDDSQTQKCPFNDPNTTASLKKEWY